MNFNHDTGTIDTGLQTLDVSSTPPLGGTAGVLTIVGTGALTLPSGTTAQEPPGVAGMIRWNTSIPQLEYFNGSVWLSFTAGTGSVTSVTLDFGTTGLTTSTLTSQTITTSGTFAVAGTLIVTNGGTGLSTITTNGVVYGNGTSPVGVTAAGTQYQVLNAGASGVPVFDALHLDQPAAVTGTLPVGNGGTGVNTIGAAGEVVYSNGTTQAYTAVGTSGQVLISGGSGSPTWTSAPTISGANITNNTIPNSALVNSSVTIGTTTIALGGTSTSLAGVTSLTLTGGASNVTGVGTPSNASDAVPLSYLQAALAGLEWKAEAQAATTVDLGSVTYNNGASGVGATLTNAGVQTAFAVDGYTASLNDRILVKNQAAPTQNGIYTVTNAGSGSTNWVLTRATDANSSASIDNATLYVTNGTSNGGSAWTQTTANPTIGTNNIVFVQTAGAGGNPVTSFQTTLSGLSPSSPTSGAITLSGTLNVSSGGTGATTLTAHGVLLGQGTSAVTATAVGATGTVLAGNTGADPTFQTLTGIVVTSVTGTANEVLANATSGAAQTGPVTLTIPSTFIAPGSAQITTSFQVSATDTITAAGATQGTATVLTTDYNVVTTAAAGTGVELPAGLPGRVITVVNRGANPVLVYPASGASIDGLAANTAVSVPVDQVYVVGAISATQWYSTESTTVAGSGVSVTNNNGVLTITNTGVTSFSAGTTGFTPNTATTGAVTLTGNLGLGNGGTNASLTASAGSVVYSTASALALSAVGTTGYLLTSGGTGAPTWSNPATTVVQSFSLNDNSTSAIYTTTPTAATQGAVGATITLKTQNANLVFSGPSSGGAAQPTFRTLVYADLPLKLYVENPSAPTAPVASGSNSVAIGSGSSSTGSGTLALGNGSSAAIFGAMAFANGDFATAGDAQRGTYILRNVTTNATATQLWLDGTAATQALVVPNNSVWTFDILVAARRTDATGGGAGYRFVGVVRKDTTSASITFVGTPSKTVLGETNAPWDAVLTANTTTGDLRVTVSGETSKTIRWVAVVTTTEVTN